MCTCIDCIRRDKDAARRSLLRQCEQPAAGHEMLSGELAIHGLSDAGHLGGAPMQPSLSTSQLCVGPTSAAEAQGLCRNSAPGPRPSASWKQRPRWMSGVQAPSSSPSRRQGCGQGLDARGASSSSCGMTTPSPTYAFLPAGLRLLRT